MKKFPMLGAALTTILIAGTLTTSAFAVSAPADDAGDYSYNTGKQSYEARMAEDHAWYDHDDSAAAGYSFLTGSEAALSRSNTFDGMPAEENMEEEAIEAWFDNNALGEGSAWSEGQYDEAAVSSYGYFIGQAAYQQRHASFSDSSGYEVVSDTTGYDSAADAAATENGVLAALCNDADFETYKVLADQSELNFVWLSSDSDPCGCSGYLPNEAGDENSTCVVMEKIDGIWYVMKVPGSFDTSEFLCGCIIKCN